MTSPLGVPPPHDDLPTFLAPYAQSQMSRRLSARSSHTSCTGKRSSTRITKQGNAGNSPHYVQRRRTTATHTARDYSRTPRDDPYLTKEQRLWNYYHSRRKVTDFRPFSWHPDALPSEMSQALMPVNDNAMGNTISGLENLAVANTELYSVQQSIQDAFLVGYGYPVTTPSASFTQEATAPEVFNSPIELVTQESTPDYSVYGDPSQTLGLYSESYHTPDYHVARLSQSSALEFTAVDEPYTIPTSSSQPQQHIDAAQYIQIKELPDMPKVEGEELVGIGLYDREEASEPGYTTKNGPMQSVQSKELKLEEAWQPPNSDDDSGDSSDEGEEAEELSMHTCPTAEAQPALFPNNSDLSNQSFFFSDDVDSYTEDDQYTNYLALNGGLQAMEQVKPLPAGTGNISWF